MGKGFFKIFSPETSAKRMKIPMSFIDYKNGELPRKVFLRDRFGNMWPIGVTKIERHFYFQYGWEKFVEDNAVEFGDFLIFDYDGNELFDFKLLGRTRCEKKGAGGLKLDVKEEETEEMSVEHQKSVEAKGKNWASDSNDSSFSDDNDEEYMVEEDEDEEYEETSNKVPHHVEDDDEDEEKEYEEEEEIDEEGENQRAYRFKRKAPCSKAFVCKVRKRHDPFGVDIFKSGLVTQPKNPYFIAKIRSNRRDQLYIPTDVVRDNNLVLPSSMTIRDSAGREFDSRLKNWKDGRIWLVGGWRSLCRWNLVEKNDSCICEFVRGKRNKALYLQVKVLHEGASSAMC